MRRSAVTVVPISDQREYVVVVVVVVFSRM